MTMTVTEFLLARIAEDEAAARAAIGSTRINEFGEVLNVDMWHQRDWSEIDGNQRDHVERWHPTRVLAECEAKRRIVEEHRPDADEQFCGCCWLDDLASWEPSPCPTMRALASVYADHPDYRDEWRVIG